VPNSATPPASREARPPRPGHHQADGSTTNFFGPLFCGGRDEPRSIRSRGGHHVEFGYALAQGKRIILVGHRENVFNYLPEIEFIETWPQALDALGPALRGAA
jgi:hypothetical protein